MDRIRETIGGVRDDGETVVARAEAAEAKANALKQIIAEKDHEIQSLQDRLQKTDDALAIAEHDITESQAAEQAARATIEGLVRRITLLEEEMDGFKRNMKETEEKFRQLEVKAEHGKTAARS
ncbi:tropomyosin [Mycena capillaripes]|nr:tropomyosin [Mycena capillaripes]